MPRATWILGLAMLAGVFSMPVVAAEAGQRLMELPAADRAAIAELIGTDVIVAALPAIPIADPSRFLFPASSSERVYRLREDDEGERQEHHRWESDAHAEGRVWRYHAGDTETGFVERDAGGSFLLSGIEDRRENALTRYQPAEPLLLQGMVPGEERTRRMAVSVFDPASPKDLLHEGSLDVSFRYLGAFRVQTAAGRYDTVLTKSIFRGNIGPARITDVQYRFFAKDVGIVATVERRDVEAAVVYHSAFRAARLLAADASMQAECTAPAVQAPPSAAC